MKALCEAYDCLKHPRHGDLQGEGTDPALDARREVECYELVVDGRGYAACGAAEWEVVGLPRFLRTLGGDGLATPL